MDSTYIIALCLVCLATGSSLAIFLNPLVGFLLKGLGIASLRNEKLYQKAVKSGHVIEATLVKSSPFTESYTVNDVEFRRETNKNYCKYQYELNGRKHTRRFACDGEAPKKLKLYYLGRFGKAVPYDLLGTKYYPWIKSYFIITLILTVILVVASMVYGLNETIEYVMDAIKKWGGVK